MSGGPDFSPEMLKLFLNGRINRVAMKEGWDRPAALAHVRKSAKRANILLGDFDLAMRGRLTDGRKRAALWGWLGHVPAELGIALHNDGSQERMGCE
ncbi:MAG: hypothetical protein AAGG69_02110 [Pseudomonadota bacterium]